MLFNFVPYADAAHFKNLGWAYNRCMNLLSDTDTALFVDHDAMFTTGDWYRCIELALEENPSFSCLTCITNRIGRHYQKAPGIDRKSNDILYHRQAGQRFLTQHGTRVVDITNEKELSGVVIVLRRSAWGKVKFREKPNQLLGIDNALHRDLRRAGLKIGLMQGIYVYHWYRNSQR
jgi:GT2 family glycosyltransferase